MLDHDRLALVCPDQCGVHIAQCVVGLGIFGIFPELFSRSNRQSLLSRGNRNQVVHLVAPVDIQHLTNRAESVCGVGISRMDRVVLQSPHVVVPRLFIQIQ